MTGRKRELEDLISETPTEVETSGFDKLNSQNQAETSDMSPGLNTEAIDESEILLQEATKELKTLTTLKDVRSWWIKYYLKLGHRRLGRLLIGKPANRNPRRN